MDTALGCPRFGPLIRTFYGVVIKRLLMLACLCILVWHEVLSGVTLAGPSVESCVRLKCIPVPGMPKQPCCIPFVPVKGIYRVFHVNLAKL